MGVDQPQCLMVLKSSLSVIINIQHLRNAALCRYSAPQKRNPSLFQFLQFSCVGLLRFFFSLSMQRMKNIWITEKMVMVVLMTMIAAKASDTNDVYDPCLDASVQKWDGFTFGLAFANNESFFSNQVQFSPCDSRLGLAGGTAKVAIFRPKVDELSLLTVNGSSPAEGGAYMVAFAGRKYAARSVPVLISDSTMTIKSFTLVLEFQKGTLQKLYWKQFGCKSCSKDMVCFNGQDCAVPNSKCTSNGGIVDCGVGVQLAFSGTDKNLEALNSWYEVSNLRQYSLYGLYSDLRDSISGLGKIF